MGEEGLAKRVSIGLVGQHTETYGQLERHWLTIGEGWRLEVGGELEG